MNKDNVSGKFDQVAGKVKQGAGEIIGDDSLANEGAAQQVKGHVKEAWGNAKDTARDIADNHRTDAERGAHNVRDSITSTAEDTKDRINRGLDNIQREDDLKHRRAS
jgi:uncharacterized protein YjbJ (UPF0337 family)